jgi:DNA-binding transcriptional regulator YdaS (Cro superfamily)
MGDALMASVDNLIVSIPAKSIFRSKTFWINLAVFAPLVAQWVTGHHWVAPEDSAMIVAAANIGLRILTNQPVTVPGVKS